MVGLVLFAAPMFGQDRVALVIGNNAYQQAKELYNPTRDAQSVSSALKTAGYSVTTVLDGDNREMVRALSRFCSNHKNAESAVFYFAGHGMEVEGQNYLIPTDANLEEKADLKLETLALQDVMEQMENANMGLKIVVLDCCRDDPFRSVRRSWMNTRSSGGGLAEVKQDEMAEGTVLVFAGEPGRTVPDGSGSNSPFTTAFLEQLSTPGKSLMSILTGIAKGVDGEQKPWFTFDGSAANLVALNDYVLYVGQAVAVSTPTPTPSVSQPEPEPKPSMPVAQPAPGASSGDGSAAFGGVRKWTQGSSGKTIDAEYISSDGDNVVLKFSNGRQFTLPISSLSQKDQAWISNRTN